MGAEGRCRTLMLGLALMAPMAVPGAMGADLLLSGGSIHDGSGAPPVVGDVAVRDGRIVAIGRFQAGKVDNIIDCRGMVVAPGFIDVHTHTDGTINKPGVRPCLNYVAQGCTTMLVGNCGGGPVDIAGFLNGIRTNGAGANIMALVPHGSIRRKVMGGERRVPSADELQQMRQLVDSAMRDGAWGISTGLIYPPGSYSETPELVELAKVVASHGGVYVSHIRDEGGRVVEAVAEAIRIGRESGAPVHISHFKSMQIPNWGLVRKAAALIEEARSKGLKVTADQYPYTANSFSLMDALLPEEQIEWCKRTEINARMSRDPGFAALVRNVIADQFGRTKKLVVAASKKFPDYVGKSLKDIAAEQGMEVVDLVLKIIAEESPEVVSHSMSEEDVRWAMRLPWVATASDGAARALDPAEHHHPRNFGTFARKIGRYAIEDKILPLAAAIRSATGLPADIFAIPERGYLRPGYHADIVVFDPAAYRDRATFESPQQYATGMRHVLIAGQMAVRDGRPTEKLLGAPLARHSTGASGGAAFQVRVEIDEVVCHLPPYEETNNGSGMFWGSGSPQIARIGDRLFVSAFEHVEGCAPLNNARWALYERRTDGWRLCQRDPKDRTREPSPLAVSHSGRLLMSVNPTLAPWVPAAAADAQKATLKSGGDVSQRSVGGPARPEFLEFDPARPDAEPKHLIPSWEGAPKFTEHSYRTFAADGPAGEFILFQNIGSTHSQWAFLDREGGWKTGELIWPEGEDPRYAPYHDERARVNYPNVVLHGRSAHFIGTSPYNIWNRIDPLRTETWGRDKWGWRMRKLHYAWTPDITKSPFNPWIVVADTMDHGGTITLGDTYLAPDGHLHVVWLENPIHPKLRDVHFPDIKRDWKLWHAILNEGKIIAKKVLFAGGETLGPVQPAGRPRFHVDTANRIYLFYNLQGATRETKTESGNFAVMLRADGTVSAPVRLPLAKPLTDVFFTASPRAGNHTSDAVDLLVADSADGKPVARYVRLSFSR